MARLRRYYDYFTIYDIRRAVDYLESGVDVDVYTYGG